MIKSILPILLLLLISSSCQKCDCQECEKELKWHRMRYTIPLELPNEKNKPLSTKPEDNELTVSISKSGVYTINGVEYDKDHLKDGISKAVEESTYEIRTVKIAGNKEVEYQYVFRVLAVCQTNEWEPILAYDE